MDLRITRGTNAGGKKYRAGEIVRDADPRDVRLLVGLGFAEEHTGEPEQSEPSKRKRGRPKKAESPVNRMDETPETRSDG